MLPKIDDLIGPNIYIFWKLVFAISKKVNTNIPIQAEANAIQLVVHIALNFSFCNCIIESDCKVCIDAIRAGGKLIP